MATATTTTTTTAIKAKAIDQYLRESPVSATKKGKVGVAAAAMGSTKAPVPTLWPEGPDDYSSSTKTKQHENEEDLYGYGDGAPTPRTGGADDRTNTAAPRRSSLSGGKQRRSARRASIGYTGEMTLVLPTGETRKKRTSISFADTTEVKEVQPVSDMVDDSNRLWFQATEYEHIQEKIFDMIHEAKESNNAGKDRPESMCLRGLEPVLDRSIAANRKEASDTLMDEQKALKMQGRYDQDYLRDMYMFHSVDAQVRAEERASEDAKEVAEYLKITRRMCRRMSC
jgi:hypothetical protein